LEKSKIGPCPSPRPLATDEFHAPVFSDLFQSPKENQSNLSRAANVGSPTGLNIDALNLHSAQDPLALRFLSTSERRKVGARPKSNMDRPVLKNDFIDKSLNVFQLFRRYGSGGHVECGDRLAHVERNGRNVE